LSIIESGNIIPVSSLISQLDQVLTNLPEQPEPAGTSSQKSTPAEHPKKKITEITEPTEPEPSPSEEKSAEPDNEDHSSPPWETEEPPPIEEHSAVAYQDKAAVVESDKPSPPAAMQREIRKDWIDFIAYLKELKPWMAQNLQQASDIRDHGLELQIAFVSDSDCTLLRTVENRQVLTEHVLDFFQKEYVIHFITPADSEDPDMKASEGPKKQRQKLATHPLVLMAEEIFGGQVGDIRIGSKSR
jgi:DNA polymerase-3 subunit gamma/tau